MFHLIVITSFILIQTYLTVKVYRFISEFFKNLKIKRILSFTLLTIITYFNLSFIFIIFFYDSKPNQHSDFAFYTFFYPSGVWFGMSILLFLIFMIKDIILLIYKSFYYIVKKLFIQKARKTETNFSESRRKFLKGLSAGLALPPIFGSLYGVAMDSSEFEITTNRIKFYNLPAKLKGLKIAQLSDIHAGIYLRKKKIVEAVKIVNKLNPDIIVLTGDYILNSERYIYPCIEAFSKLKATIGIYSCIGNHDNMVNRELIVKELKSANLNILIEENQKLSYNGQEFYVAGTEDLWYPIKPNLKKALKDIPEESFKILLSHQPDIFDEAVKRNVNLTLSGHTHGGQISIPFFGMPLNIVMFVTHYISGLFKKDKSYLYVNNGIGFVGPPFRLNVPPEISLITLI